LETKVAVIEHDLKQIQVVFGRLDLAIEKIGDVSNSINKMIAIHDLKLSGQETVNQDLYDAMEVHRKESTENNKELHSRITTTSRELSDKVDQTEVKIMTSIKELKESIDKEEEKNKKRIDNLEKTKYIMIGGGIVLGALITKILPIILEFFQ
jgi:cellobiose-specific phosphotransferase system component IIB